MSILNPPCKLNKVDNINREHYYVNDDDVLYYWGDFLSNKGPDGGDVNQFISNLKKSPERREKPEWWFKEQAIDRAANIISKTCTYFQNYTWVPVPPSRDKSDARYDSRLLDILNKVRFPSKADVREIITQRNGREPAHTSQKSKRARPKPEEIYKNYVFHPELIKLSDKNFVVFDDMLTTGCQFRACERIIKENIPTAKVVGIFLAHVKREPEFEAVQDNDIIF